MPKPFDATLKDRPGRLTLFQGVRAVRESTTYQAILDEGRAEGAQRLVLHHGRKTLGEPDEAICRALQEITNLDRLERLLDHAQDVSSWQELLQTS